MTEIISIENALCCVCSFYTIVLANPLADEYNMLV